MSELTAPTPPKPTLHAFFYGDDGLRAGWSVLLFLLLLLATGRGSAWLTTHLHLLPTPDPTAPRLIRPRSALVNDGMSFLVVALVSFLMSKIERRPFSRYGLALARSLPDLLKGLAVGFLGLSALIGGLLLTHSIAFDGLQLHGAIALTYALKWAIAFLCVGFAEEFATRGYLQYTVARGIAGLTRTLDPTTRFSHLIGFWVAAFLFSMCIFMLGHIGNPGESIWGIVAVGLAGAVLAFSLYRTGTLWWAIGFHTAWDWAQSFFYGTSDSGLPAEGHLLASHPTGSTLLSGGSAGPEGSLLAIPALLLVALVIHLTLPRRPYLLTPDQTPPPL